MSWCTKEIIEISGFSKPTVLKDLRNCIYELKYTDNSAKPVKYYKYEDLPERYKDKLKEAGIEDTIKAKDDEDTNILNAKTSNFTKKYLLADPKKQKQAVLRCRLVEFYLKKDPSLNVQRWLDKTLNECIEFDELGNVTQKQLFDWLDKYKIAKAKGENLVEVFVDGRGRAKGKRIAMTKEMEDIAIAHFRRTSKLNIKNIYKFMCQQFGDEMCSYDVLNRFKKEWERNNPVEALFAKNPDAAKSKYLVALGNMSEKARYRNHYWELDSTPADIMCSDGKRYTILGAIDIYTRRPVMLVEERSDKYSISRLLRKGILTLGIPENVVIDNGRDYTSNHFESICRNLEIEQHITPPFSGDKKPHIERFFRTLSRGLFEGLPGYIGANVAEKMAIKSKVSFEDKIKSIERWKQERLNKSDEEKKAFEELFSIKKANIGIDISTTLSRDELQGWIDNWIKNHYEQNLHKGLSCKPIEKWNESTIPVKGIGDIRMLDILLGESIEKKVHKKGIVDDKCEYWGAELENYMGKKVRVMRTDDLGKVIVYDAEDMRFICEAFDYSRLGIKREIAAAAQKRQRKLFRQIARGIKEAESLGLADMRDVISNAKDVIEANTMMTTKYTEVTKMLLDAPKEIEKQTKREADKIREEFRASGERPIFKDLIDRFVWDIKNKRVDESTMVLARKQPLVWEIAQREAV